MLNLAKYIRISRDLPSSVSIRWIHYALAPVSIVPPLKMIISLFHDPTTDPGTAPNRHDEKDDAGDALHRLSSLIMGRLFL